jgi:hypothetical protein
MTWFRIALTFILISCLGLQGYAGELDTKPYSTGTLIVTWSRGDSPEAAPADRLNIKCGYASKTYTLPVKFIMLPITPDDPPDYEIALKDLLPRPESFPRTYYCISVGALGAMESGKVSDEYAFTVTEALPLVPEDVIAPVVVIGSPVNQAIVPRKSKVNILVTIGLDSGPITEVVVFVAGRSVCPPLLQAPYVCAWQVPAAANRIYPIQATGKDASGNVGLSKPVQVRSDRP